MIQRKHENLVCVSKILDVYKRQVHEPLIQSTLVRTTKDLGIENDLATEYSCSDDCLTWTVKIREDVKFTDGDVYKRQLPGCPLNNCFSLHLRS